MTGRFTGRGFDEGKMQKNTDLKAILHSKRANIYYLEKCRLMQKDGRILYLTESKKENFYWNIPIANTTCILLGSGTSITQAAMRMLASAGVLVGFCGTGGTPLLMANEIEWMTPQNEYRPTEYMQGWMKFWFDEESRLIAAKKFQQARMNYLCSVWTRDQDLNNEGFFGDEANLTTMLKRYREQISMAPGVGKLFQIEAEITKQLYKMAVRVTQYGDFSRRRESSDMANNFLNHGNYLAYGLAATTLWVLGIPHGFAVMHGKTRRGALVFDVADLIKDALVLPWAFICAKGSASEQEFRQQCLRAFVKHKSLDFMFNQVKKIALQEDENNSS